MAQPQRAGRILMDYNRILAQSRYTREERLKYKFSKPKFKSLSQRTIKHKEINNRALFPNHYTKLARPCQEAESAVYAWTSRHLWALGRNPATTGTDVSGGCRVGRGSSRHPGRDNIPLILLIWLQIWHETDFYSYFIHFWTPLFSAYNHTPFCM